MVLSLVTLMAAAAEAAPITTVALSPASSTLAVGDSVALAVEVRGAVDLFDYQFDIVFNPLVLRADGVEDGGFLTSEGGVSVFGGPLVLTIDNTGGVVTVLDSLLGPVPPTTGATGSGFLGLIQFTALGAGSGGVALANVIFQDSSGALIDTLGSNADVQVSAASGAVPEPEPLILVATGAAGLWRRRRRPALD
jgi:hypothetical protein